MEKKFTIRDLKELCFEKDELTKTPKNLKHITYKFYFFKVLSMVSNKVPALLLATSTVLANSNTILALILIIASIALNAVSGTIKGALDEITQLREAYSVEFFERLGNSMLSFTRNRVEKNDDSGKSNILTTTAIGEIIKNRFQHKYWIFDETFQNVMNAVMFVVTFSGLIKLLSSQVSSMTFFYIVIFVTLLLKIRIFSVEFKRCTVDYETRRDLRRSLRDVGRDLKEVEPMNKKHITFMLDKLVKYQNLSLSYERKETKERNKNVILVSVLNSIAIILVVLKIAFEGGIDTLTSIKFASIITLSQLFSNILSSVESSVRAIYREKETIESYKVHNEDYLLVYDVYKIYSNDTEVPYSQNTYELLPFRYTYPNTNFTISCIKSIILQRGILTLLKGESGAGKSTLVKILSGEIKISNEKKENLSTVKYFNDDSKLGTGNVFEEITLELDEKNVDIARLNEIIEGIRLKNKFKSIDDLKTISSVELSNGMTQRILLARTLYNLGESDLVVVDEPIGSLDSKTARDVMEFIKEFCNRDKKRFIIVCTHQYNIISDLIEETYEIVPVTPNLSEIK